MGDAAETITHVPLLLATPEDTNQYEGHPPTSKSLKRPLQVHQLTHEVVVPGTLSRDHEEPEEAIRQEHLHLLVVGGQVAGRVVTSVLVAPPPFVPRQGQLVGSQGAGARGETERGGREFC